MMIILVFVFLIFLCWGSFLNVVAYRSISDVPFLKKRSFCPSCEHFIEWFYNIPVFSWFFLKGRCQYCGARISILYPLIEILTAVIMTGLFVKIFMLHGFYFFNLKTIFSFFSYFIFFSALLVATRTDFQALVIPQIFSLWLVPFGMIFAYLGFLKINFMQSFIGAIFGYAILWIVAVVFKYITKKEGMGVGDMELLSLIGAFLGPFCVWVTIFIASVSGLLFATSCILITKKKGMIKIPLGPFLSLGAVIYFFFDKWCIWFLFK
ncbi:prepilin peptidase [Candidatus Babeliales bacterium]|nr:prepilin peptidase [Candidatus Babeliales bacterium]